MKTKVLVQILVVALIGTVTVQAQENINREVKKEIRKAKREMRKAQKEMKKEMKDIHFDSFIYHGDLDDENLILLEGKLDNLSDVLEDLDVEFECLEHIPELESLSGIYELEGLEALAELEELAHFDIEMPELYFESPDYDIEMPEMLEFKEFYYESGSSMELSKSLENVSISKDFYFEVKERASNLSMKIDGTLESGDLTISVKKPDGTVFQKFQISPLADVDWSQQIDLDEEDVYIGKWTINLAGEGATGNYNLVFRAK